MKKNVIMSLLGLILFSCSQQDSDLNTNPETVNLIIEVKKEAKLNDIFSKLNALDIEIKQLNGFTHDCSASRDNVTELINILNQKDYIKNGNFKATPSNVYFDVSSNKVKILTRFFNLNTINQTDLLGLISRLNFLDAKSNDKQVIVNVPVDKGDYFKNKILQNIDFESVEIVKNDCFVLKHSKVLSANFPTSVNANQNVVVQIQYEVHNGCGSFGNFDEVFSQNNRKVKLNAQYNTCLICTEGFQTLTVNYNFNSNKVGLNTIEFMQPDGTLLTYSVNVLASNNNCFTNEHTKVISASFPATVNVNQNITVPVTFEAHNSCVFFDNFETVNVGNTKNVKVITKYDSCIFCAQAVENKTVNFNFQITNIGVHEFKFMQPDGSLLSYLVTAQ